MRPSAADHLRLQRLQRLRSERVRVGLICVRYAANPGIPLPVIAGRSREIIFRIVNGVARVERRWPADAGFYTSFGGPFDGAPIQGFARGGPRSFENIKRGNAHASRGEFDPRP